jgi:rhodanese-related sulfurtransferase
MNMNISFLCRWLGCTMLVFEAAALAISPAGVRQRLTAGDTLTLIDVRSTALFKQGHIPNAINVPARLAPLKHLPPLGRVVVYDDGLCDNQAQAAAAALNQKPGISAEVLEGGFAAWEAAQFLTTKPSGMTQETAPMITYAQLKRAPASDTILVDLRGNRSPAPAAKNKTASQPLTDLQVDFPNIRIARSPAEALMVNKSSLAGSAIPPLLVLIDDGDGAAREWARTLKANGIQRFAVLAGGEDILARKGLPGKQRSVMHGPTAPPAINTNH